LKCNPSRWSATGRLWLDPHGLLLLSCRHARVDILSSDLDRPRSGGLQPRREVGDHSRTPGQLCRVDQHRVRGVGTGRAILRVLPFQTCPARRPHRRDLAVRMHRPGPRRRLLLRRAHGPLAREGWVGVYHPASLVWGKHALYEQERMRVVGTDDGRSRRSTRCMWSQSAGIATTNGRRGYDF
jgi:hypothetical protein